ncbi:MAG: hypothetical protein ABSF27_08190 [Candidatus Dormibacteria bacterium]
MSRSRRLRPRPAAGLTGLEEGGRVAEQIAELGVGEPRSRYAVGDAVAAQVGLASGKVVIEVTEQAGDEGRKRLVVFVGAHSRGFGRAKLRGCRTEEVGAQNCAQLPLLLTFPHIGSVRGGCGWPSW